MPSSKRASAAEPHVPPYDATVPNMLRHLVELYGDGEAQVRGAQRLTYRELERRSAELARGLLAQGVGKGTRIGLLMPNSPEFTVAFMAAARIGALVAPLSTLYQAPELRWILGHADIQLLLIADRYLNHDYLARLESAFPALAGQTAGRLALAEAPYLRSILVWGECDRGWAAPGPDTLQAAAAAARPEIDRAFLGAVEANVVPADLLCIIYTSGSTAHPKGVVHSHGPMLRHSYQKAFDYWPIETGERFISARPFFWVAGLSAVLFHALHVGACILIPPDLGPSTIRRLIEAEGATALSADETVFKALRTDPGMQAAGYEVHRLSKECAALARRSAAGARYLNPLRAARIPIAVQPPEPLIPSSYGMTESLSAHTSLPNGRLLPADKAGYCGQPMPGVVLRIADPETGRELPAGEVGEVLIGGYSLMQGLYKKEREETFTPEGLYRSGDLCVMDADGYLLFSSRIGEMIKVSGANVAPMEVENCLLAIPEVERAAVLPLPGAASEPLLAAAVQLRSGASFDEAALRGALRQQLSSYKVPRRIFALSAEEFPLTGSGKIRKSDLTPLLSERLRAEATEPAAS